MYPIQPHHFLQLSHTPHLYQGQDFLVIVTPIGGLQDVSWIVRWDRGMSIQLIENLLALNRGVPFRNTGFLVDFWGGAGVSPSSSLPSVASRTCCGLRGGTEVWPADPQPPQSQLVFAGPVHWTGKKTEIGLNPTAKDRTTGCGCTNSEFFRLPVVMFVEKSKNREKPV